MKKTEYMTIWAGGEVEHGDAITNLRKLWAQGWEIVARTRTGCMGKLTLSRTVEQEAAS